MLITVHLGRGSHSSLEKEGGISLQLDSSHAQGWPWAGEGKGNRGDAWGTAPSVLEYLHPLSLEDFYCCRFPSVHVLLSVSPLGVSGLGGPDSIKLLGTSVVLLDCNGTSGTRKHVESLFWIWAPTVADIGVSL